MPYRLLNYCIEIMRSIVEEDLNNRATYKYPFIIPIVLYTGNRKWTAPISFGESQVKDENMKCKMLDLKYKLIDINKFNVKELLNKNTMLTNVMILEKCKNNEEVLNCLRDIIYNLENNAQKEKLKTIVLYLYKDIEEKEIENIFKMIEESESEETMSTIRERISEEFRLERKKARELGLEEGRVEGRAEGMAQSMLQIIENMIRMNFKDEIIKQATGKNKGEIQKIRKQIMNV